MKTYKDFAAFERRAANGPEWLSSDWHRVGGRTFKLYEYGDTPTGNYLYLINRRTRDAIRVDYQVPCIQWVDGVRTQTKCYRFHGAEFIREMSTWRTDTL